MIVETTAGVAIARANLFDHDGKEIGQYTGATPGECVRRACSTLTLIGAHDEARAIAEHWTATNGARA